MRPSSAKSGLDLGSLGAYLKEGKVQVASEAGYLNGVAGDAGSWTYAHILDEQQWAGSTGKPDPNGEAKGGFFLEFAMAFAGLAPFYPTAFSHWGMRPDRTRHAPL